MILVLQNADFSGDNINNMPDIPDTPGGGSGTPFTQLMYKFGVLSDIHLYVEGLSHNDTIKNYDNNNNFKKAIDFMIEREIEDVYITGDIGYTAWPGGYDSNCVKELEKYANILQEKGQWQLNKEEEIYYPYHPVTGNHDSKQTDENWKTYTGHDKNFVIEKDGDVFIGLSLPDGGSSKTPYNILDAGGNLTGFIKEKLEEYAGRRIFLFMHYPIPGFSGLYFESTAYDYYGFSEDSNEDNKLLSKILSTRNAVVFHGHTHLQFEFEEKCPEINASYFSNKNVALMHVPSCGYPRGNDEKPITSGKSQGYVVEVYTDGVKIIGADFINNKLLDEYTYSYLIPGDQSVISSKTKINAFLSEGDGILEPGQEATVKITLSKNLDTTLKVVATGEICIETDEGEVNSTLINFDNNSREHTIVIKALEDAVGGSAAIRIMPNNEEDKNQFWSTSVSMIITGKQGEEVILPHGATNTKILQEKVKGASVNPNEIQIEPIEVYGTKTIETDENGDIKYQGDETKVYNITNKTSQATLLCLYQLYLNSSDTAIYLGAALDECTIEVYKENDLWTGAYVTNTQRAMSSSANTTYIVGKKMEGDTTEPILRAGCNSIATSPALKGNYIIEDLIFEVYGPTYDVTTSGSYAREGGIAGTSGTKYGSMIIKDSGTFIWNRAMVKLLPAEGEGTVYLELGDAHFNNDLSYNSDMSDVVSKWRIYDSINAETFREVKDLTGIKMPGSEGSLKLQAVFE